MFTSSVHTTKVPNSVLKLKELLLVWTAARLPVVYVLYDEFQALQNWPSMPAAGLITSNNRRRLLFERFTKMSAFIGITSPKRSAMRSQECGMLEVVFKQSSSLKLV